jgi:hypothetical protein
MPNVETENDVRPARDRRCEDVAVIRIGQRQPFDTGFVAGDVGAGQNPLHDIAGAQQAVPAGNPRRRDIPYPFVVDHVGPARVNDVIDRQLHQQIPQMERVEHVRIVQDDRYGRRRAVRFHARSDRPYPLSVRSAPVEPALPGA